MSDITYGITLGLGIPFIIIALVVIRGWCCPNFLRAEHKKLGLYNVSKNSERAIQKELSSKAFQDFKQGKLTACVYNEIKHIYNNKKYVDDYIVYASKHKHEYMLVFLRDPNNYPVAVSTQV